MKPRDIADRLAEKMKAAPEIDAVDVAGAGFLNLRFKPSFWHGI
jgi:arginyl-tRNA synthetase